MARNGKRQGGSEQSRSKKGGAAQGKAAVSPRARKRRLGQLNEAAGWLLRDSKRLLNKHSKRVRPEVADQLRQLRGDLEVQCEPKPAKREADRLEDAAAALDDALDKHMGRYRKSPLREYVEAIGWAVILALLIRAFVFEAFKIPTGSMIPTLHVHDHLFVNKFLYGIKIPFTRIKFLDFRVPKAGEIIVFEYPYNDDPESIGKDLIKRVIGTPGDLVQLRDNHVQINGKKIPRRLLAERHDCGEMVEAIAACSADDTRFCLLAPAMDGGEPRELSGTWPTRKAAADAAQQLEGFACTRHTECTNGIEYTSQFRVPGERAEDLIRWLRPLNDGTWPPLAAAPPSYGPHAQRYAKADNPDFPAFKVPQGHLLVMGDNRDNSKDGRYFGLVPLDTIKGKAGFIWYAYRRRWWVPNFDRIGLVVHGEPAGGACPSKP
jgi:signal peptidase I